ncbi:MAG: YigZ family protein, partial [Planctomycetota bacterium]
MLDRYLTLGAPFEFEPDPVKGSRFLVDMAPAGDPDAAMAFVKIVQARYPDATHHCFAWRIGPEGKETRANDDGEPGGSAGRPILAQIEGHEVCDVVVVVTRYFGGTKLGVGGLMRAYGGAAGQALDRAPIEAREITEPWAIAFPYSCSGAVEGVLHAHRLALIDAEYG